MTELEKKIYNAFLEVYPKLKKEVEAINSNARYISLPFYCDGVIDNAIYDVTLGKFVKIEYRKHKGTDVKYCSFPIK